MHFTEWLAHRDIAALLQLLEGADYFSPQSYNSAFVAGLDDLLGRIDDPAAREQIEAMKGFDFGSYIARSLARAGFVGDSLQEHFHALVVRLLLKPGKLFRGWNPERHGPLDRRLECHLERDSQHSRKGTQPSKMDDEHRSRRDGRPIRRKAASFFRLGGPVQTPCCRPAWPLGRCYSRLEIGRKRGQRHGGTCQFGSPSVYAIKREVQEIKKLAHEFAIQHDDPGFLNAVERGMAGEARTVAKRQQAMAARQAGRKDGLGPGTATNEARGNRFAIDSHGLQVPRTAK